MVRTLVTPQQQNISILVPQNYVGRQIEILLYPLDELVEEPQTAKPNNAAKYKGILSKEEGEKFNQYIQQARSEWDKDFKLIPMLSLIILLTGLMLKEVRL